MTGTSPHPETLHPLGRRANRFRRRRLGAAAAGLAATAAGQSASATIIADLTANASPAQGSFTVDGTINGQIDLLVTANMMASSLTLQATPGAMMNPGSTAQLHTVPVGMNDDLVLMAIGETVDGSLAYTSDASLVVAGTPSPGWSAGATGYAGFSFDNGGTMNYGWLQIQVGAGLDDFTVLEWAYEDSGAAIVVGAVPEPSTAILIGLGLAGLAAWRPKRPPTPRADRKP